MSISRDPVFFAMMQSSLQRAYPSGLPSNQVLTQFSMPYDTVGVSDALNLTWTQQGYPYGWCETVATSGAGTYTLTEPMGACWLLRVDAFKPPDASVTLSVSISGGSPTTIERIDPAQTLIYADDLFTWSQASILGMIGMQPWGTLGNWSDVSALWPLQALAPTTWSDANAMWLGPSTGSASSEQLGEWLLRKWVWFSSTDSYTFNLAGDEEATLYLDGTMITGPATTTEPLSTTQSVNVGWHLLSISCLNTGTARSPTGVLISVQDALGNIIENGSDSLALGSSWETSGFINPTWTAVSSEDDMRYAWYVIPASRITSEEVTLTVSVNGSPIIQGIQWYSAAPWRWDEGTIYDATANPATPAGVAPVTTKEVVG